MTDRRNRRFGYLFAVSTRRFPGRSIEYELSVYPPPRLRDYCHRCVKTLFAMLICLLLPAAFAQAQNTGTVFGTITLEGIVNSVQPINFEFCSSSNGQVFVLTTTLDQNGSYVLNNVPAGTYDVGIKGAKWLRTVVHITVPTTSPVNASLLGGDANDDNSVDTTDFGILVGAYGTSLGGAGYDDRADFNSDLSVDTTDFGILVGNYDGVGSPYQITFQAYSPALTGPGQVRLSWALTPAPMGTVLYNVYRSVGAPAHGSVPYRAGLTKTTFVDVNVSPGTYYYQVSALTSNGCALSTELQAVVVNPPSSNLSPTIVGNNPYYLTGYQQTGPSVGYPSYQATVFDGVLVSYLVFNQSNQSSELFHSSGNKHPDGVLFSYATDFRTLGSFNTVPPYHNLLSFTSSVLPNTNQTVYNPSGTDPYIQFTINDQVNNTAYPLTATYEATVSGILMTLNPTRSLNVAWRLADSPDSNNTGSVIAAQDQGRPAITINRRRPGNGIGHKLPLPNPLASDAAQGVAANGEIYPIRDIRYYLNNQTAVDAYYTSNSTANEALTPDEDGSLFPRVENDYTSWGRAFGAGVIPFFFGPAATQNAAGQYTNTTFPGGDSTPPFRLAWVSNAGQAGSQNGNDFGFLAHGNAPRCNLVFGPNVSSSQPSFVANYTITDYYGAAVSSGSSDPIQASNLIAAKDGSGNILYYYYPLYRIPNDPLHQSVIALPATVKGPLNGWFHLKVTLVPSPTPTNPTLENADDLEFGVYTNSASDPITPAYLFDPNPAIILSSASGDPGISSIIGARSVRLTSHESLFLPDNAPPNYQLSDPQDVKFIGRYNYLHGFSAPPYSNGTPNNGTPDPAALYLFGSIEQRGGADVDQPYQDYAQSFAQAYGQALPAETGYNSAPLLTPITAWALTNEPNQSYGGSAGVQYYVTRVLSYGYQGIRDGYTGTGITPKIIAPNIQTVNWPADGVPFGWVIDFLAAGGAQYIDYFGVHTYTGNETSWEECDVPGQLTYLRYLLDNAADPKAHNMLIWITEHGWTFLSNADKPRLQAAYIVRRFALAAALGIPNERDAYFYTTSHGFLEYFLEGGAPNRGGMAFRVMSEKTHDKHFYKDLLANVTNAKYVHAIDYTDGTPTGGNINDMIVVWGDDFLDPAFVPSGQSPVTLKFTFNEPVDAVFDIMGNDITPSADTTSKPGYYIYTVPATSSPVYIKVAHSAVINNGVGISGWILPSGQKNYAAASNAPIPGIGDASSSSSSLSSNNVGLFGGDYTTLNDSIWQYDYFDGNKKIWISANKPTMTTPAYATVTFSKTVNIDTVVGVVPSSNGHVCGVRDCDIQILTTNLQWQTVRSIRNNTSEWVLAVNLLQALNVTQPVACNGIRLAIYTVNNGNFLTDTTPLYQNALGSGTNYDDSLQRAMVYELEAYGPSGQ